MGKLNNFKKNICKFLGHIKSGKRYQKYDYEDGRISWITECPICKTKLFCITTDPKYITSTELTD